MDYNPGFTPKFDVLCQAYRDHASCVDVFGYVWRMCQLRERRCSAATQTIANTLQIDKRTVITALKQLCADGWIEDLTPDRRGAPHIYRDTERLRIVPFAVVCDQTGDLRSPDDSAETSGDLRSQTGDLRSQTGDLRSQTGDLRSPKDTKETTRNARASASHSGADAPDADRVYDLEYIEDDLAGECPACGAAVIYANLKRSRAVCPDCGVGLRVRDQDGTILFKPPQKQRGASDQRLGVLLADCPQRFADVPYYARDRERLLLLWREQNEVMAETLHRVMDHYAIGRARWNQIASQALAWASRRIEAERESARETEKRETPAASSTLDRMREAGYTEEQLTALGIGG